MPGRAAGAPAGVPAGGVPGASTSTAPGGSATVPEALPTETAEETDRLLLYALALSAAAVPVLPLTRRRRSPTAVAPADAPRPAPDPEPAPDNVSRLPTDLNGIYELGRLDERLSQQRNRRS
ncbi:hypothetical protein V6U89_16875 [Micromonospora sp. CPCC 206171]|uniref:hypothetical protein n=1 Tax=Micromonospora sp. CPCC 206171 TaxID=3122405 RepID=UPI002FF3540B